MTSFPATFQDDSGEIRLDGTLTITGGTISGATFIEGDGADGHFNGGALVVQNTGAGDSDAFGVYDVVGSEVFTVTTGPAADLNDSCLVSAPFHVLLPTPYITGGFDAVSVSSGLMIVRVLASGLLDTSLAAGVKFPTADPHIDGAWWDNAGVLTRSAG